MSSDGSSASVSSLSGSAHSSPSFPTSPTGSRADPSSVLSPVPLTTTLPLSNPVSASTSTTSTTSTTPQTSTTTSQSTPAQTSTTPTDETTPSAQSQTSASATATPAGSASSATSTAAVRTITTSSAFTSQVATTVASTNSAGSVVFITSTVPEVFTTSVTTTTGSTGGGSSNTGIIVGAVVGGVTGIILLIVLILCIRKRSHRDEFDGNFDPDRVLGHTDVGSGTLPNVDFAEEVTPFPQSQPQAYPEHHPSMRQLGKAPYIPVPTSLGPNEYYPGGSSTDSRPRKHMQYGGAASGAPPVGAYVPQVNTYGAGPVDWHNPIPGVSPPPSTVSNTTSSTRGAKEREALARAGQGAGLASPQEVAEGSAQVVVHQDAGRAPVEEHAPPREIPPAYESIQRD